jgi:hypothetical protein
MPVMYEPVTPVELSGMKSQDAFRRYLAWLIIPPLLGYMLGFVLVRMPGYERWGGSAWGPTLDYAFQTGSQNADVVIFGDSSALFAVDPVQMGAKLGLKVINLPNTIGGLPVLGDMALKRYLAQNRPPKIILFYFCAWDLDYARAAGTRLFEGEEMLARHGSLSQIVRFAVAHPSELFYFPFRVYNSLGPTSLRHWLDSRGKIPEVAASLGHVRNSLYFPPLSNDCTIPASNIAQQRDASVRSLMVKYASPQTRTMLYLAPAPGCQNAGALQSAVTENLPTPPPAVFPPGDFTSDGYYAHLLPEAVPQATDLAVAAVQSYLESK